MVYSEPCFIQNPSIFRSLKHSEPCQASTMEYFAKILNGYNYFRNISFSRSLPCEKMCIFNTYLIFTPEAFFQCKKVWGLRGPGALNFLYIYLLMYSNKLAYLQLITVLVCGSSPWKKVMNKVT